MAVAPPASGKVRTGGGRERGTFGPNGVYQVRGLLVRGGGGRYGGEDRNVTRMAEPRGRDGHDTRGGADRVGDGSHGGLGVRGALGVDDDGQRTVDAGAEALG